MVSPNAAEGWCQAQPSADRPSLGGQVEAERKQYDGTGEGKRQRTATPLDELAGDCEGDPGELAAVSTRRHWYGTG